MTIRNKDVGREGNPGQFAPTRLNPGLPDMHGTSFPSPDSAHPPLHREGGDTKAGKSVIPGAVLDFVFEVQLIAETLEFESSARGHDSGTWVTVADCADPKVAGNNCFAVTCEVHEAAHVSVGVEPGWRHERVEIWTENPQDLKNSGVHWANVMTDEATGQRWVIDYTARQFDPDASFPAIEPLDQWSKRTVALILDRFGGHVEAITIH